MKPSKITDLSHTLEPAMNMYPGSAPPVFESVATAETDGYNELRINILTHTGTHLDCPAHILPDGLTVDKAPVEMFFGPAIIIKCTSISAGEIITREHIEKYETVINGSDFVLFHTGWSRLWNKPGYYGDFPVLSEDAAGYLATLNLKGVGFDTPSCDPVASTDLPCHKIFLGHGIILVENLTNLHLLPKTGFYFSCFPLKIKDGDGSFIRAIGII